MIIDGRSADAPASLDYDVLIVGSGPAGVTLAHELGGTGLRIAVVEGGGEAFESENQELYDGAVSGLEEVDLTAIRLRMLGGTSNHWGGRCLPLDPIDFARRPPGGMTGWPFSREALDPFYARAHDYLEIGAYEYGVSIPQGVTENDLLLAGDDTVENAVLRFSTNPPTNFGESYRAFLAGSDEVHLWLWTNLVGLDISPEGTVEAVRTRTLSGEERSFTAGAVVLACGAVENARQMLLANAANGSSFGAAGDLIGACYMDHPTGGSAFLWPREPLPRKANWSEDLTAPDGTAVGYVWRLHDAVLEREGLLNAQFYLIPYSSDTAARQRERDANSGMQGLKSLAKWTLGREGRNFSLGRSYCNFIQNADALVAQTVFPRGSVDRVLLKYETEQQPSRDSRVRLTEATDTLGLALPELHWSPTEDDKRSLVRTTELIGQAVGAADLGRLEFEEGVEERYWNFTTSWHQLGTTRMAEGPSDGVVDPDCRVHGTRNLYMAGGSVMPTAGRANPTLTITALAIRLADHIKSERGA
jgi:choline dehydrogenase-like flavoprotein